MGCFVIGFDWIHLGILNPENLAPIHSILRFDQHMTLSFGMTVLPFSFRRSFLQHEEQLSTNCKAH